MIAILWRKYWIELRGRWLMLTALAALPSIATAGDSLRHKPDATAPAALFGVVGLILICLLPAQLSSTGVTTAMGRRPRGAPDPSLLFTLSLPVRRRKLLLYRATFGLLALGAGAVAAMVINALVCATFVSAVAPGPVFTDGLWVLLALVPLYFLDTLLSLRFSEIAVFQIQAFSIAGIVIALGWAGVPVFTTIFHHLSLLAIAPAAIGACLISAALAALTVRSLERQDF
jgi:hypothetical protein